MLISFGVSNFLSLADRQEIGFVAPQRNNNVSGKAVPIGLGKAPTSLRLVECIYGPNASGKTNLLFALQSLIGLVKNSAKNDENDNLPDVGFKLDREYTSVPAECDIEFLVNNVHYQYGLQWTIEGVVQEWLYEYSYSERKSRRVLFHRDINEDEEYYFGKHLKGNNKTISDITLKNQLFLSVSARQKHKQLNAIYQFFRMFNFRFSEELIEPAIGEQLEHIDKYSEIENALNEIDIPACSIRVDNRDVSDKQKDLYSELVNLMHPNDKRNFEPPSTVPEVKFVRKNAQGDEIVFGFSEESKGTAAILAFLAYALPTLENGGVIVLDELESSLHPYLTSWIVKLFMSDCFNKGNAQILFTTHETNLLSSGLLERDQIWLTEKTRSGKTIVSSLDEFKPRKSANIETSYLEGRFGGVPYIGSQLDLLRENKLP